jgi:hypothetical protein
MTEHTTGSDYRPPTKEDTASNSTDVGVALSATADALVTEYCAPDAVDAATGEHGIIDAGDDAEILGGDR